MNHTLLSANNEKNIQVRVYEGKLNGRVVEWHMADDGRGRIWIDRINFKDAKVNEYGVYSEVIDSGALTNKPFEYCAQTPPLMRELAGADCKEGTNYADMTPALDLMLPIQHYREKWGIKRP